MILISLFFYILGATAQAGLTEDVDRWTISLRDSYTGARVDGRGLEQVFPASIPKVGKLALMRNNLLYSTLKPAVKGILRKKLNGGFFESTGIGARILPQESIVFELQRLGPDIARFSEEFETDAPRYGASAEALEDGALFSILLRTMAALNGVPTGGRREALQAYSLGAGLSSPWIAQAFPQAQHPLLYQILQERQNINKNNLIEVSLKAGGLAVMAGGYMALGSLNGPMMEFLYKAGAVLGLLESTFQGQMLREPLLRTLTVARVAEGELRRLSAAFPGRLSMARFHELVFIVALLHKTLQLDSRQARELEGVFADYLPLNLTHVRELHGVAQESVSHVAQRVECSYLLRRVARK